MVIVGEYRETEYICSLERAQARHRRPRGDDLRAAIFISLYLVPFPHQFFSSVPFPPCYAPLREQRARIFNSHFIYAGQKIASPPLVTDVIPLLRHAVFFFSPSYETPCISSLRSLGVRVKPH